MEASISRVCRRGGRALAIEPPEVDQDACRREAEEETVQRVGCRAPRPSTLLILPPKLQRPYVYPRDVTVAMRSRACVRAG